MDGKHIRLFGIDAPEIRHLQRCLDKEDQRYHCGIHSGLALEKIIIGRDVTCNWTRRHFDRLVAVCHVAGSGDGATAQIEINAEMVRSGWAVDCPLYSRSKHNSLGKYAAEEAEAKREKRGLWSGKFYRAEFCKDFI